MRQKRQLSKDTISPAQRRIYEFIKERTSLNGFPPSVREIAQQFGFKSPSTVQHHLKSLESAGILRRYPSKPRALTLLENRSSSSEESSPYSESSDNAFSVPLLGDVAAGTGVLADENELDQFVLPGQLIGKQPGEIFMLKVHGDSMIDIGIFEDDIVVVQADQQATRGDIVVALINDGQEGTVKVLDNTGGTKRLLARNSSYSSEKATIEFKDERDKIVGKVIALLRKY